ncbi:MAG: GNAT family N-acetyltransferase [Armatimonadetes bacterium]|nr:GNAT family N-acetyltransferase [Armatimonadota bacterium]
MPALDIREMAPEEEYFVSTCSHVNESEEIDRCGQRRREWLRAMRAQGLRVLTARLDGKLVGFAYLSPIEASPLGPIGRDIAVVPCLWVVPDAQGHGAGRALMEAAEEDARRQGSKGIATSAFYGDFWFMPASFFEKIDYSPVRRRDNEAILWKRFDPSAEAPSFLERSYDFVLMPGKVVIDLFYNTFCETSDIEAQRVREVAADFGDAVVLNEHSADDRETLLQHQLPRAIFINGEEIGWGYEAPKEGIADAISNALERP